MLALYILAKVGEVLSSLPASAASVERIWSSAAFVSTDLREEVYIRHNFPLVHSKV